MKKHLLSVIILVCISICYLIPLWRSPFYISHDGEAHVARFAAYFKAYSDGQIPPRWAGDLNFGFGSPVFIFYYPLPGTIASTLHMFHINYETIFKIIISTAFILSFLTFYLWISDTVRKDIAFFSALLYGLAPYHFLNTYVRGDVAEMMALAFVPLIFLFIDRLKKGASVGTFIFGSLTYALLILSHNAISLMFSVLFLFYVIFTKSKKQKVFVPFAMLASGLLISAFFWIPALFEARYTNAKLFVGNMYKDHFPSFLALLYSPWNFGANVNSIDGLSPQIGPFAIILGLCGLGSFFVGKKFTRIVIFWYTVFFVSIILTLSFSKLAWEYLPLLALFQFPWRFSALSSFVISVLAVYILTTFVPNRKVVLFLIGIFLFISIQYVKIQAGISRNDTYYESYEGTTYYHGQASSIWTAGDPGKKVEKPLSLIDGDGIISQVVRKSNKHAFIIDAKTNVKVLDNTIYFPGWQALVDGEKIPIEFQDINHRGLITFSIPQGIHNVTIKFSESPIRLISDLISLITLIFIVMLLLLGKRVVKLAKAL